MDRLRVLAVVVALPLALASCHHPASTSGSEGAPAVAPSAPATGPAAAPASFNGTWVLDKLGWSHSSCDVAVGALPAWDKAAWDKAKFNGNFHMQFDLEADKQGRFKIRLEGQGSGAGARVVEYECSGDDVDACKDVPTQVFKPVGGVWTFTDRSSMPHKGECGREGLVQTMTHDGGAVRMVKKWMLTTWPAPGGSIFKCNPVGPIPSGAKTRCERMLVFEATKG